MHAPPTLASASTVLRLSLHVLAASIWVGGQLVLGGLVPAVRREAPGAIPAVARAFGRLAWPAYAVLLATGVWNVVVIGAPRGAYAAVLVAEIAVAVLSGAAAWLHQRATSRMGLALWGAASSLFAIAALVIGVWLAG
jgi:putative copper export protein